MTRTLAETEAELALIQKRRESFNRIIQGGLTRDEEQLERERLLAVGTELAALEEKRKPPPKERVFPEALTMTRDQRLKKAEEIRADPRFYRGPGYQHPDGVRGALTKAEHEAMVQIHQELTELAVADTSGTGP